MKKIVNFIVTNKYFSILVAFIFIYSLFFIFSPFNLRNGDFINDYFYIYNNSNSDNWFANLFKNDTIYGSVLYNFMIFVNYKIFNYSLVYIKIFSYIINVAILIVSFFFLKPGLDRNERKAFVIFLVFSVDFIGVFGTASMNYIKMVILCNLLSFVLFRKVLKCDNKAKYFYLCLSFLLQFFAFFYLSVFVYVFLFLKTRDNLKVVLISVLLYVLCLVANYSIFMNFSKTNIDNAAVYILSSPLVPMIRIFTGEYIEYFFYVSSALFVIYVLVSCASFICCKNLEGLLCLFILIINILLSYFYISGEKYSYSAVYLINRYLFACTLYYIVKRIKSIDDINYELSKKYFNKEKICLVLATSVVFVATVFSVIFVYINRNIYINSRNELEYSYAYDNGRFYGSDMSYIYEDTKENIVKKYDFFKKKGYIVVDNILLEKRTELISKNSVDYIRGTRVDSSGERWLQSNFAFETYVADGIMNLSLYLPNGTNRITLYANNVEIGSYQMEKGPNLFGFGVYEFYGQDIVVYGIFESEFKGPLDDEGYWSCILMDIYYSSSYGFYPTEPNGATWVGLRFGQFYNVIDCSYIYNFYVPEHVETRNLKLYIDRLFVDEFTISSGFNKIYVDFSKYLEKNVVVEFVINKRLSSGNDERVLGAILSNVTKYDAKNNISRIVEIDSPYTTINFSGNSKNIVSIYVNGHEEEICDLNISDCCILYTKEFIGQSIEIVEIYKIGVEESLIAEILQSDHYGLYENDDIIIWTRDKFGFYLDNNVYSRYYFSIYEIDSLNENKYTVLINGGTVFEGFLYGGMNDIYIDLSNCIGQEIYLEFILEKYQDPSVDGRTLGCVISGMDGE